MDTKVDNTQVANVWKDFQARFGEKPKEARVIKKQLDKDDFLKIMITQMKNQDPTKPFDAEKLATEVAQITGVEQLQNVNKNLEKSMQAARPMEKLAMANLIGTHVLVDRNRFAYDAGTMHPVGFEIPENAEQVKVSVISAESGEVVATKELGPQEKGQVSFGWDGKKNTGIANKSGHYMIKVEATAPGGKPIQTNFQKSVQVVGVGFEGTEPMFLVGDMRNPEKIGMTNVVRIEQPRGEAKK
jgi:flagellar basal-body rod modification protein FlgD